MKTKLLSVLLALVLMLSAVSVLASCNRDDTPPQDNNNPPASDPSDKDPDGGDEKGDEWSDNYEIITIAEALEKCGEPGNTTVERYYICGTVTEMKNVNFGEMIVTDETGSIYVYGTYSADGELAYSQMTDKALKGDLVLLHCILQNYEGTKEVKNARLIDFKKSEQTFDESDYTEMSIDEARDAKTGDKVKVDGVVARITYSFGMVPSGFYLVDESNSIYVYSSDAAARVAVGNKVTLLASKTYWVLDKEQDNANRFGYKGCNQLEEAKVVANDGKTDNAYDRSWIPTSTVKNILETPFTEDITTTIYKVNALVTRSQGEGFVNYYFHDLDGTTGSYTYTQCNGSDFDWLDKFDGKICTVYLSVINAKSTASGCVYRFIPIEVIDENFKFGFWDAPEYAVKYVALSKIMSVYTGDPALKLESTVSSTLLGFEGVTVEYTSSDPEVIYFVEDNGVTVMHGGKAGTATVTAKATYKGSEYSQSVTVTIEEQKNYEYVSVADAIAAEVDDVVIVKGIVGPSVVNKNGFYLIDDTGVIAVTGTDTLFEGLAIGHEVILTGKRTVTKSGSGQICLEEAEILVNLYGRHEYSTETFITGKTLADIVALQDKPEYTTSVYVVSVGVKVNQYNITLIDGNNSIILYAGGNPQYAWIAEHEGETITVELALCDWNAKGIKGCVLAIVEDGGKTLNELNFKAN